MSSGDVAVIADGLSDAAIAAELARRHARYGAAPAMAVAATREMLVWALGEARYATPVEQVWATIGAVRASAVPGAPARLLGVFARGGVIHNLFDPAAVLGGAAGDGAGMVLGGAAGDGAGMVLVLRHPAPRIAIRVDAAIGIVAVAVAVAVATEPSRGGAAGASVITADGPVTLVDTQQLIARLIGAPVSQEG